MKYILFSLLFLFVTNKSFSHASSSKIESQPTISQILPAYFAIKEALVNSDVRAANLKANAFKIIINKVQIGSLTSIQRSTFKLLKDKLIFDADHISESEDINHQRDHFKYFSANILALEKVIKLSVAPVYVQYCPMKKASWLSAEEEIKNPYYGQEMFTCGKVTETIK